MTEIDVAKISEWSLDPDLNIEFEGMSVKERSDPANPANEHMRKMMAYMKGLYESGGGGGSGTASYTPIKNSDIDKLFVKTP